MILYLLVPALILGTIKPEAVASRLNEGTRKIEDELQSNQTAFVPEDEENFQDEEDKITGQNCEQELLITASHQYCGKEFHQAMLNISRDSWCDLDRVISPYSSLTACLELMAKETRCFFPNPDIQDFFIYIHSSFFQNCTNEHDHMLEDAPQGLVIGLTLLSVSFIPVLVYLVARS